MTAPLILVLDDEALVAFDLAAMLERARYRILGPFTGTAAALAAFEKEMPDAAVLDVNLGRGKTSSDVATVLREAGIPFVFLSGYAQIDTMLDRDFVDEPRLSKPCAPTKLIETVAALLKS